MKTIKTIDNTIHRSCTVGENYQPNGIIPMFSWIIKTAHKFTKSKLDNAENAYTKKYNTYMQYNLSNINQKYYQLIMQVINPKNLQITM